MVDLGEILDPVRKQVIDLKDALLHARYRYDGLDLILETVTDPKIRGAAQEIFAVAGEKMNSVDTLHDSEWLRGRESAWMEDSFSPKKEFSNAVLSRHSRFDAIAACAAQQ